MLEASIFPWILIFIGSLDEKLIDSSNATLTLSADRGHFMFWASMVSEILESIAVLE